MPCLVFRSIPLARTRQFVADWGIYNPLLALDPSRRYQDDQFSFVNPASAVLAAAAAQIAAVPGPIDRALFYVPPEIGLNVVNELAERSDVAEIWLNPGAESLELIAKARKLGLKLITACAIIDIGERP